MLWEFISSIFILLFIYLYFDYAGSSLLCGLFSSCGQQGPPLLQSTGSRVLGLQQLWLLGSRARVYSQWQNLDQIPCCKLPLRGPLPSIRQSQREFQSMIHKEAEVIFLLMSELTKIIGPTLIKTICFPSLPILISIKGLNSYTFV